jgi:gamma-glutamyltranspeptidase/glutathione hydrolase
VIGSPPPDQGGTHLIEMLNMVEQLDLRAMGHPLESAESLSLLIRIHDAVYYAGRDQRDPRSFDVPLETIVSKEYARMRLELVRMGVPRTGVAVPPGSNHLTVVDADGNVATVLHSSMCSPWHNGLFVDGISISAAGSHYLRALPEPGDRITAIIVPNMLARDGVPIMASGSPSQSLIATVLQNVVNIVDFGMDVEQSVHLPRFGGPGPSRFDTWASAGMAATMIEADVDASLRDAVIASGVTLNVVSPWHHMCGSFEAILRDPGTGELVACGDPRRASRPDGF